MNWLIQEAAKIEDQILNRKENYDETNPVPCLCSLEQIRAQEKHFHYEEQRDIIV